ncbi:MAG TPA: NHL repeat-containing protein [Archangium sp.]|jgi:hypothetical protein|uniref:NHL repeat-containing protein n=1 Tax=Archangium sp. TaxID=1872627 RepID=UPI002EDACEF5
MRIGRLGLVGLAALAAACGEDKPAPRFLVGGTVTGLAGGGLGLQLNGTESLTRQADGPFSFETRLEDQRDYTVTVSTQPPEQDCSVEGGMGKVAGADVNGVQVRCTTRTYTLGGTVEGLSGPLTLGLDGGETLSVTQAGRFTFTTKRLKGEAYAVSVVTAPQHQRCTVSNASGTVTGNVETLSVQCYAWFALDNTQAAKTVIGQVNFSANAANQEGTTPGANTLNGPWGNPVLAGGRLYVTDQGSNRVLGFTGVPTTQGASAAFVLGQTGSKTADFGDGPTGLDTPTGLSSDGTRLAVADTRNSRILLHPALPSGTGAAATLAVGQPNLEPGSNARDCTPSALFNPEDVFLGRGKLLVADTANNRVLVWNTLPTTSGAPADLVLGQRSFSTCRANDADDADGNGVPDAPPSASTLWNPTGVWTDGTRLVVADSYNNRVLVWNQFPTTSGQPADVVLGQPSFTSRNPATTATGLNTPYFVTSTGLQLFVVDQQNHRVLGWNQFPTTPGAAANLVLGQQDFTSAFPYDPSTGGDPSARSFNQPSGVLLAWPHVVVSDAANNRVLVFESR